MPVISCKFRIQKSKEGTGRIAMWKLGIRNSYTMEATFGGSTLGDRRGTHFSTQDLKSLGFCFCDTLLDYCDPDPSKTKYCLMELTALLNKQVKDKLGTELIDSNFTVSDLETSTTGSNSSDSDGPPLQFLNQPNTCIKTKKRKRLRTRKERSRLHSEPKVQESDNKDQESNQPLENPTKAKQVIKEKKSDNMNKLVKKPFMPPTNTHPGEISQVTLWQGSKPVMNKDDPLSPLPAVKSHLEIEQLRSAAQYLHLSASLPLHKDLQQSTHLLYPIPRQRLITYKVSRGLSSIPVPEMSPGKLLLKMFPKISDKELLTSMCTKTLGNEDQTAEKLSNFQGTWKEKPQYELEKDLPFRCLPCGPKDSLFNSKMFLEPLLKSKDKRQNRESSTSKKMSNGSLPKAEFAQLIDKLNKNEISEEKSPITITRPSQSAPP